MKVQHDKTFPMPSSPAIAWEFLQNVEAVAACMPGAKLTEQVGENHHKGTVTVKMGSATEFIMRPPKAAALPLIDTSLEPTNWLKPPSTASMRASRFMETPELPVLSVPLPIRRRVWVVASTSCTSTSPRNDIVAGPTRTVTVPLWWFSSTRSVSFAPGIHPATASTSCRNCQAIAGELGIGNVLSSCTFI